MIKFVVGVGIGDDDDLTSPHISIKTLIFYKS